MLAWTASGKSHSSNDATAMVVLWRRRSMRVGSVELAI